MLKQTNSESGEQNFQQHDIQQLYQQYSGNSPPTFRKPYNQIYHPIKHHINPSPSKPSKQFATSVNIRQRLVKQKLQKQFNLVLETYTTESSKYLSENELRVVLKKLKLVSENTTQQMIESIVEYLMNDEQDIETWRVKQFVFEICKIGNDENIKNKYLQLYHNRLSQKGNKKEQKIVLRPMRVSSNSNILSKKYRTKLISASNQKRQGKQTISTSLHKTNDTNVDKKKIKIRINRQQFTKQERHLKTQI